VHITQGCGCRPLTAMPAVPGSSTSAAAAAAGLHSPHRQVHIHLEQAVVLKKPARAQAALAATCMQVDAGVAATTCEQLAGGGSVGACCSLSLRACLRVGLPALGPGGPTMQLPTALPAALHFISPVSSISFCAVLRPRGLSSS